MKIDVVKLRLSLHFALKALALNKFRAILTALGIVFGVAAVITMLAIGRGGEKEIMDQIKLVGSNNIIVGKKELLINDNSQSSSRVLSKGLTLDNIEGLRSILPGLSDVSPELSYESFAFYNNRSSRLKIVGISSSYFRMFNYQLTKGNFFSEKHELNALPVCVIGR